LASWSRRLTDAGLAKDCANLAKLYRSRTHYLIDKYGYFEFYNPETGKPLRINPYGWSTLGEVINLGETTKNEVL